MKPASVSIIESVLANDTTVSQEERGYILDACRGENLRKSRGAEELQMLSAKEVAKKLGVSEKTIKRFIAQNLLKSFKVGKLRRIRRSDLDDYLQSCKSLVISGLANTPMGNGRIV